MRPLGIGWARMGRLFFLGHARRRARLHERDHIVALDELGALEVEDLIADQDTDAPPRVVRATKASKRQLRIGKSAGSLAVSTPLVNAGSCVWSRSEFTAGRVLSGARKRHVWAHVWYATTLPTCPT